MKINLFLIVYSILSIVHLFVQILRSEIDYQKNKNYIYKRIKTPLSVSVILPIYNEEKKIVEKVINSILNQQDILLELIIIDDMSNNRTELINSVYYKYEYKDNVKIYYPKKNIGKRHCQKIGFDNAEGDYIVTIDSDTIIHDPFSIAKLISRFVDDEKIGAVTGDVKVENNANNLLTKLISYRYWTAFNQEREAQSLSNVVMCCSGPFSAYKSDVIDIVKDKYISQNFLNVPCTYGDDRHLTNLILSEGYTAVYNFNASSHTYVPETLKAYIKQQVRWNKSFYREIIWTLQFILKKPFYLLYDLSMQIVLPPMLLIAITLMIKESIVQKNMTYIFIYIFILISMSLIRVFYAIYRTKDKGFFIFIIYGFLHVCILIPVRIYALCNLRDNNWGTR
ncbi:TPA: glycosyltransferase [Enterococcus hirae]